jgi:hypothetical protein
MDLQLKTLNALSLYQKLSMLGGTVLAALVFPGNLAVLAVFAAFSALSTASVAAYQVKKRLRIEGASEGALRGREGPTAVETLKEAVFTYSGWQHVIGVVLGWVQTMDLFFLSLLRFPGKDVGLYAAVLKMANFSLLLPAALANLFTIWVGRRAATGGYTQELRELKRLTSLLGIGIFIQALILYGASPLIFKALSHGRWGSEEIANMRTWFAWILGGASLFGAMFLPASWLAIRRQLSGLFVQVYVPWVLISLSVYFVMIRNQAFGGPYLGAAVANMVITTCYAALVWRYLRKVA